MKSSVTFIFGDQLGSNRGYEGGGEGGRREYREEKIKKILFRQRDASSSLSLCIEPCAESVSGHIMLVGSSFTWNFFAQPDRFKASIRGHLRRLTGGGCMHTCMHMDRARRKSSERRKSYRVRWNDFAATSHRARCFPSPPRNYFPCNQQFVSVTSTLIFLINSHTGGTLCSISV